MTAVSVRFAALCWRSGLLAVAAVAVWCSVAQAWSGPVTLSTQGAEADVPQVGIAADQSAVFAWTRFDGANFLAESRTRSAAGTLRPFTTLSDQGESALQPQVAVDGDGDAVVTWTRSDGANSRIQATAGP